MDRRTHHRLARDSRRVGFFAGAVVLCWLGSGPVLAEQASSLKHPTAAPENKLLMADDGRLSNALFTPTQQPSTIQLSDRVSFSFMLAPDQTGKREELTGTSGRWQVVDSLALHAGVGFSSQTNNEPAGDCQAYRIDCLGYDRADTDRQVESYSVGANWRASDRLSLDLNVYSQPLEGALGGSFWRGEFVELDLTQSEGVDLGLSCGFSAGRLGDIELGLQLSRIDEQNRFLEPDPFAAASLGLGWRRGVFSGDLTSRFLGSINDDNDLEDGWTTFDISFGWRTPWNANLSVGAKNVLDKPAPEGRLLNNSNIDDLFGRVPYVRYQQDL